MGSMLDSLQLLVVHCSYNTTDRSLYTVKNKPNPRFIYNHGSHFAVSETLFQHTKNVHAVGAYTVVYFLTRC